ncbi:hypothetical protein [Massilia sp. S19_KUP03_FR1]|uniref:hypothetical protein n=1 Tax=Massilia sp. S19_KUP03_FR1 TaxID=3025503 RepID=UPI002FCDB028
MPTDWLFSWLTSAFGLALIGAAVMATFFIWRTMLGEAFSQIGDKPLVLAYSCVAVGLVGMSFVGSYIEFSGRVANGLLHETQRWSIVPGWMIYTTMLSLVFVLPLLGLVGVPVAASLLTRGLLTPLNIAVRVLFLWSALTIFGWILPGNEWHRTHRLESFMMGLKNLLPGIIFIALPFMFAIYRGTRAFRLGRRDASG